MHNRCDRDVTISTTSVVSVFEGHDDDPRLNTGKDDAVEEEKQKRGEVTALYRKDEMSNICKIECNKHGREYDRDDKADQNSTDVNADKPWQIRKKSRPIFKWVGHVHSPEIAI